MRARTIFLLAFTVLITVFLMMNTDAVDFDFIFVEQKISKLVVIGVCTFVGFILGYWAGRPKVTVSSYDQKYDPQDDEPGDRNKYLSDEDRDYIS